MTCHEQGIFQPIKIAEHCIGCIPPFRGLFPPGCCVGLTSGRAHQKIDGPPARDNPT
jgi:hypothetical protein